MRKLIITADDFGAAPEVNEAIERAHRNGVLTTTSLMVTGAAADDAVARARRNRDLHVGLHLVLVDGVPALAPDTIPDLVGPSGRFRSNMALSGLNFAVNPRARRQLRAEITAQFERFRVTGLPLDHCNGHKHFHVHPQIAEVTLQIGRNFGLRSLRVPVEPADVLNQIERTGARRGEWLLNRFGKRLFRRVHEFRMFAPDRVFGIRWSGGMRKERLMALLRNLPEGISEIFCHPALAGGFDGSSAEYAYDEEFAALTDPEVMSLARRLEIRLGSFAEFMPSRLQNHPY